MLQQWVNHIIKPKPTQHETAFIDFLKLQNNAKFLTKMTQ